mmetsp:Transcript_21733/g.47227  ORF Transcript_21733/g.47227 Transcript_21733/m.47227 type:complete len:200 (-) Transcript_21733:433-1032(-)
MCRDCLHHEYWRWMAGRRLPYDFAEVAVSETHRWHYLHWHPLYHPPPCYHASSCPSSLPSHSCPSPMTTVTFSYSSPCPSSYSAPISTSFASPSPPPVHSATIHHNRDVIYRIPWCVIPMPVLMWMLWKMPLFVEDWKEVEWMIWIVRNNDCCCCRYNNHCLLAIVRQNQRRRMQYHFLAIVGGCYCSWIRGGMDEGFP